MLDLKIESTDLKMRLGAISDICNNIYKKMDRTAVVEKEREWNILMTGMLFMAGLQKLEGLGDTAAARISKDKNGVVFNSVQSTYKKLQGLKVTDMAISTGHEELLSMDLAAPFLVVEKFKVFREMLECKAQQLSRDLDSHSETLRKLCRGFTGTSWKEGLGPDATFQDLKDTAKTSLDLMEGKMMRAAFAKFEKADGLFKRLLILWEGWWALQI